MPKKKLPWRTLVMSDRDRVGPYTRQEIRQIILKVKAEREAEAAQGRDAQKRAGMETDQG